MMLSAKELDNAFSQMDTSGDGSVDFDEFFAVYAKIADPAGGMFYSVTRKGNLDRMKVHVNELRRQFVPSLMFRREAAYAELEKRDAAAREGKLSKTEDCRQTKDERLPAGGDVHEMDTSGDGHDKEEIGACSRRSASHSAKRTSMMLWPRWTRTTAEMWFDEFKQWWDRNIESADGSTTQCLYSCVRFRTISATD